MKKDITTENKNLKGKKTENENIENDLELLAEQKEEAEIAAEKDPKKKAEKLVAAKKLPKILKKSYTRKNLDKLIKHIQIPTHQELVKNYFVPNPKKEGKFYIPPETQIPKLKFKRMKQIGKDVASQKFSIKIIPLAATVAIFAAVIILVGMFKNVVARKVLISAMQGAFGAKTDIEYINVEILGSSIEIRKLEQGYKDEPMKNLFELEKVIIDFNLTELLRGKFDLQNIAVEGINVMTPRTTSAELPKKPESNQKNAFQLNLENRMNIAQDAAKEELDNLFKQYNPESILSSLQNQLSSPAVAQEVYKTGEELVNKWSKKPEEISKQIDDFSKKVDTLVNTDWSKVNDPIKIKEAITTITSAINEGKALVNETQTIVNDVKADSAVIKDASQKVNAAIKKDTEFVNSELNKIKSFTLKDGTRLLSGPIDTIMYKTVGKYYPYLKQGLGLAMQAKNSSSGSAEKKAKDVKATPHKRLPGVDVYYKRDNVPKFLIERMSISGVNFAGLATNISSDMDKRGEPAVADLSFDISNQKHSGNITVDARTDTQNPLVAANYSGTNYPVAFDAPTFKMNSSSTISGRLAAKDTGAFTIGATLALKNLEFQTEKFEPEFAYNLYSRALSYLKEMSIGVDLIFADEQDFDMKISSDADKQFAEILKKLVNDELNNLKTQAKKKITELLEQQTGGATSKIKEFIDIENGLNKESIKLDKVNSLLDSKKKELQKQLTDSSKQSAGDALGGALKDIKLPF